MRNTIITAWGLRDIKEKDSEKGVSCGFGESSSVVRFHFREAKRLLCYFMKYSAALPVVNCW